MKIECEYCTKKLNDKNYEKHVKVCKIINDENMYETYSKFHELFNFNITWSEYLYKFKIGVSTFSKHRRYNKIPINKKLHNRPHTEESIKKLKKNAGGYRKGSGRGKSGWYKNYWCDSTYELCWLIYQLDIGNKPKRNKKGYEYYYEGNLFKYYPDFILNNIIYEIKGYETNKDKHKYKSVTDMKLEILMKDDLNEIFEYVQNKYETKKYHELYDDYNITHLKKDSDRKKRTRNRKMDRCKCGNNKEKASPICKVCNNIKQRKVERPTYKKLMKEIRETNYCAVGRKYGVSDNAIRKWVKYYENNL